MINQVPPDHARKLDQFYTNPEYAKAFVDAISKFVNLDTFDLMLEPSAGDGSFFSLLDPTKRIGVDLDPKCAGVEKHDFLTWQPPAGKKIIAIGNPPFGKNASLAVKFFNKSAKFCEAICFVIPKTFRKASVENRLNKHFHKIYDVDAPPNSFIFNGKPYDVWCCAQIWVKMEAARDVVEQLRFCQLRDWFEIVEPEFSDFAIQRVGGGAGTVKTKMFKQFSKASHFFIKTHHPAVLPVFEKLKVDSVKFNTAGNPSISASELIKLWTSQANEDGLNITLQSVKKPKNIITHDATSAKLFEQI